MSHVCWPEANGTATSIEETYALEHDTTPFPVATEPMEQNDGQRLADALDLGHDLVRALPNARRSDVAESVAMQRALDEHGRSPWLANR